MDDKDMPDAVTVILTEARFRVPRAWRLCASCRRTYSTPGVQIFPLPYARAAKSALFQTADTRSPGESVFTRAASQAPVPEAG